MILDSITLENFGVYSGRQEIDHLFKQYLPVIQSQITQHLSKIGSWLEIVIRLSSLLTQKPTEEAIAKLPAQVQKHHRCLSEKLGTVAEYYEPNETPYCFQHKNG